MQNLRQAKEDRIDAQYYTTEIRIDYSELIRNAKDFVLKIEEIIDSLNPEKISDIRKELETMCN